MTTTKTNIKDITYIGIMAVLIYITAQITIPSTVPFTMQTFGIFSALQLLGGKRGTFAIITYILVFAVANIFTPTGGYIIGFIFIGLIYWAFEKLTKNNMILNFIVMIFANIVCYAFGTAWFIPMFSKANGAISIATALSYCVIPFIIPDIIKIIMSIILSNRLKPHMNLQ